MIESRPKSTPKDIEYNRSQLRRQKDPNLQQSQLQEVKSVGRRNNEIVVCAPSKRLVSGVYDILNVPNNDEATQMPEIRLDEMEKVEKPTKTR